MELVKINGLGPKNIDLLNKINIQTVEDLISFYPFRYEVLQRSDLDSANDGDKVIIDGILDKDALLYRFKGNMNKLSFRMSSDHHLVSVIVYNRAFMKNHLKAGVKVFVTGKYDKKHNSITASTIELGALSDKPIMRGVYHTVNGLSNKVIKKYIDYALNNCQELITDDVPDYLNEKYHLLDKTSACFNIHNPSDISILKQALIKLKYEELFLFMLRINQLRLENESIHAGLTRNVNYQQIEPFINNLPFKLTADQSETVSDILNDLNSHKQMNRLVQGDVGSGKTVVSIIALYINYLSGYQGAMMAPTEILAIQHYENISKLLPDLRIGLLLGSTKAKEKKELIKQLLANEIDIVVGTHALIQDDVTYHNLGLVITDEQHRFGVNQRANLKNKGINPDVLYMSATPIPRTYALTIYGDMDVSSIKSMPNGRKKVETYLKNNNEIKDVLTAMYEELKQQHQIFVVAPLIEDSEKSNLENVLSLKEKMEKAFYPHYQVGFIHGKMRNQEKDEIMNLFKENKINILISTTVIEVGVDIKNATMMVIFNAERFGLSTLHQLRGRVGRNDLECKCILISDLEKERLKIMTSTYDGFEISEADFKLRGHGDLFGVRQSGDMTFKIADLRNDFKILMQAKEDSLEFLKTKKDDHRYQHIMSFLDRFRNLD